MSGNLWMFSDKLDDEDIEIMKHEFITYYQGADYYGLGLKMFTRLAHEAGAVYKIGKKVLIRRTIFDEYLRQQYHIEQMASLAADGKEASTRQGTLVLDTDSGRMNIRFGLNDYYGFLSCGTRMEVRVDGEWIPTRLEMADNWILIGIETKDISSKQQNALPNGLICLKGGELGNETMPVKNKTTLWDLKEFFEEEFFETKKVVYVGG